MKKIVISAILALASAGVIFAQETTVSFENEISSDLISISGGESEFAGIEETVTAGIESEKVNAEVSLVAAIGNDEDNNFGLFGYEIDSAFVEFTPIEMLTIEFNNDYFTAGSYLPVEDDNVGNGNLSNAFALILKPIENLSVGAGINLPSVFADVDDKFDLNAGVDYTTDVFSVGAAVRSPLNNLGFGVFGSFTGVEGLMIDLGYSYNDEFCDVAGNLLSLGATYEVSILSFGVDCVTNFGNDGNDLYSALSVEAGITDNLSASVQGTLNMDFADSAATDTCIEIAATYANESHELSAGVAADFADSMTISFPVSYKYSF